MRTVQFDKIAWSNFGHPNEVRMARRAKDRMSEAICHGPTLIYLSSLSSLNDNWHPIALLPQL